MRGPLRAQGWYYLIGGLWPLLHWCSFVRVAGPKPDRFQTEVAGVLFAATGAALLADSAAGSPSTAARVLGAAAGSGVALAEFRFRRSLRAIFRADAVLNAGFAAAAARPDARRPRDAEDERPA